MYILQGTTFILHPGTGSRSLATAIREAGGHCVGQHHQVIPRKVTESVVCTLRNPWNLMGSWYFRETLGNVPFDAWLKDTMMFNRQAYQGPDNMGLFYGSLWATHYIRFERMQGTLNEITEDLGLPKLKLGHEGKTTHNTSYIKLYDHETSEIIRKAYAYQIRLGNYTF